jgi:tetratricopeptide (TPR) repeat protein
MEYLYGALGIYEQLRDSAGRAHTLTNMGATLYQLAEYDRGLKVTTEAHRLMTPSTERGMLTKCICNMGAFYGEFGNLRAAAEWHARAAELSRQYGDQVTEALSLVNLGFDYKLLGEYDEALAHLAAAHALARANGASHIEADVFRFRGEIHHALGDFEQAVASFRLAIEIAQENGLGMAAVEANVALGSVLLAKGDMDEAVGTLSGALAAALEVGAKRSVYEAHEMLARAYEACGDLRAALDHERAFHTVRTDVFHSHDKALAEQRLAVAEVERLRHQSELATTHTELRLLKAQMQPHFLLNALNNVSALIHVDPPRADRMIERLGSLLRLSIEQSQSPAHALRDELRFVVAYLEVEQVRLGGRLLFEFDVDSSVLACEVPHLLLQPLVENAICHGFASPLRRLRLVIRARREFGGTLVLIVEDNGAGLPRGWTMDHAGTGLGNTAQRLKFIYPGEHIFGIAPVEAGGVRVEIRIPTSVRAASKRAIGRDRDAGAQGSTFPPSASA